MTTAAAATGGIGIGAAATPFIQSLLPSAKAKALGADVEVDISNLKPGELMIVGWRGLPVWILRRTPEMIKDMRALEDRLRDPDSEIASQQPQYATNWHRSIRPELLVLIGICTHAGCSPRFTPEHAHPEVGDWWKGGFLCPCHKSQFDYSGRVYEGLSPAPRNLPVPPYRYESESMIVIGDGSLKT